MLFQSLYKASFQLPSSAQKSECKRPLPFILAKENKCFQSCQCCWTETQLLLEKAKNCYLIINVLKIAVCWLLVELRFWKSIWGPLQRTKWEWAKMKKKGQIEKMQIKHLPFAYCKNTFIAHSSWHLKGCLLNKQMKTWMVGMCASVLEKCATLLPQLPDLGRIKWALR